MQKEKGFVKAIIIITIALIIAKFVFKIDPANIWNNHSVQLAIQWIKINTIIAWNYIVYTINYLINAVQPMIHKIK
jgi:hypothetical protein